MVRSVRWRQARSLSLWLLVCCTAAAPASNQGHVYSTWDVFEPDKCASIWLIKRYIDPKASFHFYKRGEAIEAGIPFDTPDAQFRRYQTSSTFETLLRHQGSHDPTLVYIGRLIHDIEVNIWERKALPETQDVEAELRRMIPEGDPARAVKSCLDYFDAFYRCPPGKCAARGR